jgi:hypothetical protein
VRLQGPGGAPPASVLLPAVVTMALHLSDQLGEVGAQRSGAVMSGSGVSSPEWGKGRGWPTKLIL